MITEMERQYRVPQAIGRLWVSRSAVLPLLDGLDEVEEEAREECVAAINRYRKRIWGGAPVVVCSRKSEYSDLTARLRFDAAIEVKPLTDQQVDEYVTRLGEQGGRLTAVLAENEQLREMAHTPLWLDVMSVASGDRNLSTLPRAEIRNGVFNAYIKRVLLEHRRPIQEWSPAQCLRWLRWIAQQLKQTEQTLFRLEEMQPNWLNGELEQKRYRRWLQGTGALVFGLALAVSLGVLFGLLRGVVNGAVVGLVGGLVGGTLGWQSLGENDKADRKVIVATTDLALDWRRGAQALGSWLVRGLVFGAVVGLVVQLFAKNAAGLLFTGGAARLATGLVVGLAGGLAFGMVTGLSALLKPKFEIKPESRPNQAMWRSTQNGLVSGLLAGCVGGLSMALFGGLMDGWSSALYYGFFGALCWALIGGLEGSRGGEAAFRHLVLRWMLWREGVTPKPWRYVAFLDALTDHLLLDRIGGAYKFKHDLLQKHIAQLDDDFIAALDREARRK